jgi:hypothetical protein
MAALLVLPAAPARAQGLRGEIGTSASFIDYRSVVRDSLPEALVPGDGTTRVLPDGTVVSCIPGGHCYWYRAGADRDAMPVVQDLALTAWPGWRGVSARLQLRGRLGRDDLWPRGDQEIEAIQASIDVERRAWRLRAGRQEHGGGLGTYGFDGAAFLWRGWGGLRLEAFAGRSLAGVLNQAHDGFLLHDADRLGPDEGGTLWGLQTGVVRPGRLAASLLYQRELRFDRAGLYSERVGLDVWGAVRRATLEFDAAWDLAAADFNAARLRLQHPLPRRLHAAIEARRHEPYFDLWTIWGAFTPVGFTEGSLRLDWAAGPGLRFDASGAYRDYAETYAGTRFAPIEGDGWRATAGAGWTSGAWSAHGAYRLHWGFGAYRSSADLAGGRRLGARAFVGAHATATQQLLEFRFGDGRSLGAGLEARAGWGDVQIFGGFGVYRHAYDERPGFPDNTQFRARLGARLTFGSEPGTAAAAARRTAPPEGGVLP